MMRYFGDGGVKVNDDDWDIVTLVADFTFLQKVAIHGVYGYEMILSNYRTLQIYKKAGYTAKLCSLAAQLQKLVQTALEKRREALKPETQ